MPLWTFPITGALLIVAGGLFALSKDPQPLMGFCVMLGFIYIAVGVMAGLMTRWIESRNRSSNP